jgi:hypothetical protein
MALSCTIACDDSFDVTWIARSDYEEAGRVADKELGRLVPVASWRDWITNNIHNRGHAPTPASSTGAGVGAKSGNPGR